VTAITPTSELIAAVKAGEMFILVDAEDRENEGDLIVAAEFADAAAVNFMARHGRGLICLALDRPRADALGLAPLPSTGSRHQTAFTPSIEAREGVTTGISAQDRACTIAVAIDGAKGSADIVSPGHVFPVVARDGGVLVRAGHTEASVDLARMAGCTPAAMICEVMNEDGTMARLPDLLAMAEEFGLKIGTIADLIAHRRLHDHLIEKIHSAPVETCHGQFTLTIFRNNLDGAEHAVLSRGEPEPGRPTLVRMHRVDFASDVLGISERSDLVDTALAAIAQHDSAGMIVLLRHLDPLRLSRHFGLVEEPDSEARIVREFGVGAQILRAMQVRSMILLLASPPKRYVGLEAFELEVSGWQMLENHD
jgi:3,4-dihydroxy 2-butanone 4-phosphate synthase/GTP cyclohydrolase II